MPCFNNYAYCKLIITNIIVKIGFCEMRLAKKVFKKSLSDTKYKMFSAFSRLLGFPLLPLRHVVFAILILNPVIDCVD